jgi:hypothetical protein
MEVFGSSSSAINRSLQCTHATRRRAPMAQSFGQKLSSQPQVAVFTTARSLLLVSSGVVRKCEKEGTMTRITKWITKWGFSPTTRF